MFLFCLNFKPSYVFNNFTYLILLFFFFSTLHTQKHKERDRHKPKHKKTMDMSPSLVLPNIMVPDKVRALLHSSVM